MRFGPVTRGAAVASLAAAALVLVTGFSSAQQTKATPKVAPPVPGESTDDPSTSAEEITERRAMERFLSLLEKNPRRGTALDRVYGYHVERGSLDTFIKTIVDRLAKAPTDGAGWMVLGLLESQRGRDAVAVEAFKKAETTRPDHPLTSY